MALGAWPGRRKKGGSCVNRGSKMQPTGNPALDGEPDGKRRLLFGLRISLVVYSLITVLVTAVAVYLPWLYISRDNIGDLARQINGEIVKGLSGEVDGIFRSAASSQQTLRDVLQAGLVDFEDKKAREKLFFAVMQANPQFSWVSVGKPNGDLYGIQRRDASFLRAEESKWNPDTKEATRTLDYYVETGDLVHYYQTKIRVDDYYSPARDWYKQAAASEEPIWTDLYLFATSGKPGLNTAVRLMRDGKLVGCLTIAIALERVSNYLDQIDIARHGAVFIVDRTGRMIAYRKLEANAEPEAASTYLKPLGEIKEPLLHLATTALADNGVGLEKLTGQQQLLVDSPSLGGRYFVSIAPAGHLGWVLGTVLPERDFMTRINQNQDKLFLALLVALCIVGLMAIAAARALFVSPLRKIFGQIVDISRFDLSQARYVPSRIRELDTLSRAVVQMTKGLASFQKFLPTELVRSLLARGIVAELGGENRTLTMMFMDLQGFTTLSEQYGHRLLPQLGEYFDEMSAQIAMCGGTIDKYLGDGVMAFWGAPAYNDDHAINACRAALACVKRLDEIRVEWRRQGKPDFRARIGLNSGRVIVGNMGSSERLNYTVVGDPVNLASRLESQNRTYGTNVIVGQTTYEAAKYEFVFRRLDTVTVKGRDEPVKIYELLAEVGATADDERFVWVKVFERGLTFYEEQNWQGAVEQFRKVVKMRGEDPPSAMFIERCEGRLSPDVVRAITGSANYAAE
jgi:adenylate cyclase